MLAYLLIFISAVFFAVSIVLGVKWRKEKNNLLKEIVKSKQNICMGIMVASVSLYLLFNVLANEDGFNIGLVIATLLLLLGSFNIVQGIRMHRHYTKQVK